MTARLPDARSHLGTLRLPNATVEVHGDLPSLVVDALGDLCDSRLHLDPGAPHLVLVAVRVDEGWTVTATPGRLTRLRPVVTGPDDADLLDALVGCLNHLSFEQDPLRLHLHAAAVEIRGTGVLLVGPSGSGKSTLALELVRRGAQYLTDESLTVLPGTTTVFAYPKPITLKSGSIERVVGDGAPAGGVAIALNGRAHVPASSWASVVPHTTVGVIVAIRHSASSPSELVPISAAETAVRLLGDSLDGARLGASAVDVVATTVAGATGWDLVFSDAADAADMIDDIRPPMRRQLAVPHRLEVVGRAPQTTDSIDPFSSGDESTRIVRFDDGATLQDGRSRALIVLDAAQVDEIEGVGDQQMTAPLASLAIALGGMPRPVPPTLSDDPLSFGLPGRPIRRRPDAAPITFADVDAARRGRCTGVVVEQLRRGRVADEGVADAAIAAHRAGQFTCALLERELPRLTDLLAEAGVVPIVLKGPVSSHDAAAPAHQRDFGDLDLLVRPEQMDAAVSALLGAGFDRSFPPVSPDFDRRFAKSVTLSANFSGQFARGTPPTFELDLHRTLTSGPFGERLPLDQLHDRSVPARVNGRWYRSLHPEHRFLHSCLHVALGSAEPRLHSMRDLVGATPPSPRSIERVVGLAQEWGIGAPVRRAIVMTEARFPGAISPELTEAIRRLRPGRVERALLSTYHHRAASYSLPALASVVALRSWTDRRDFLMAHWHHRAARR